MSMAAASIKATGPGTSQLGTMELAYSLVDDYVRVQDELIAALRDEIRVLKLLLAFTYDDIPTNPLESVPASQPEKYKVSHGSKSWMYS